MNIYLSTDLLCYTKEKIEKNILGGTQRFSLILRKWLERAGHIVYDPFSDNKLDEYDVCYGSNKTNWSIKAKRRVARIGSWHARPYSDKVKYMYVSQFCRDRLKGLPGEVIYVPYSDDLYPCREIPYIPGRIMTTSNPNRHMWDTIKVLEIMEEKGIEFEKWHTMGGNQLYCEEFPEQFVEVNHSEIEYHGILPKQEVDKLLGTANVWAYANFTDESETFCVAAVEAASLGIPVILPKRLPFTEILPNAIFVENHEEMANAVGEALKGRARSIHQGVERYSETNIMGKVVGIIESLLLSFLFFWIEEEDYILDVLEVI